MSHPIRKWLKDLLQYGRRSQVRPGEKKPPLLWLADLPRLGQMWLGHYWFRFWLDLRSTPPRVRFASHEVFSPHVRSMRPTVIKPVRPLHAAKRNLAAFGAWLDNGGPERLAASLAKGTVGIIVGAVGAAVFTATSVVGSLFAGLAGLLGLSTLAAAIGVNGVGREASKALRATMTGTVALRDGFMEGFGVLVTGLRTPRELAWTFATVTGTVGLILLTVLQSIGVTAAPKASEARKQIVHRPLMPAQETVVAQADNDAFGGFPDPFAPGPADEPVSAPPQLEPEPIPTRAADLAAEVVRTALPFDVARFDLPDDDEQFLVESQPADSSVPLADDDWLTATRPALVERPPIVPAAYREMEEVEPSVNQRRVQPTDTGDRLLPMSAAMNVTIQKSQPAQAKPGELLWYDLVVTNNSDERMPGVTVEEHVATPHRVADARPAASFDDGVLSWQLEDLGAGEARRLSVAVYPMSAEPIATSATLRPTAAFSSVTLVQAETPTEAQPPIARPDPIERFDRLDEPEPRPEVPSGDLRRIKIAMTIPERVVEGAACEVRFAVTNTGEVALADVELQSVLSPTLRHPGGDLLAATIGDLAPGETKRKTLRLTAANLGDADLFAEVTTADGVSTNVRGLFSIVEPIANDAMQSSCCSPE